MTYSDHTTGLLDTLHERPTPLDVDSLFDDLRETFGVAHIVYHASNVKGLTENEPYLRLTYPDAWVERYIEQDYFSLDPVVDAGMRRFAPFDWSELDWSGRPRRDFLGDAAEHHIGLSGVSIPIRGVGGQHAIFSVTSYMLPAEWKEFLRRHIGGFQKIAHYTHQSVLDLEGVEEDVKQVRLSPRESDALQYSARGLNTDEIAEKMGVKERTVRAFIETARYKLNALNRVHAVGKAIGQGLIYPP